MACSGTSSKLKGRTISPGVVHETEVTASEVTEKAVVLTVNTATGKGAKVVTSRGAEFIVQKGDTITVEAL